MVVSLSKGQKVDITKGHSGLSKVMVGLGWDTNKYSGGFDFDLDSEAFLLTASGRVSSDKDFVFYGNLKHPSGAVEHLGDNLTGQGEGDDEELIVDLSMAPADIEKIVFTVTINEAEKRKQNFGQVSNAFIRIINQGDGQEMVRYDLAEDFSVETSVVLGELYRHGGGWKFNAIGGGFKGGLREICLNYGVTV